ncbi:MAG: Carbohydrate kinase, FGGY [Anaerolineae bacterium]|jgi:xylulokinase|nr:MAG: Carbohydrate kinase, FGGY [Anaerolineae bacterium]
MMSNEALLGIDVGTQGVKASIVSLEGNVLAHSFEPYETDYPRSGWVEHNMERNWWQGSVAAICKALQQCPLKPINLLGIGVCGLYPALGPTDATGRSLSGAILYSDSRAYAEVEEINQRYNLRLSCEELTPKLLWFLRNEPEKARKMQMFFDAPHYLIYKLSGAYVTDTITAGLYGAIFEAPDASWREDVCKELDIPLNILPKVYPPATLVGNVTSQASKETGLAEGTPVIAGMPDLFGSMLSAGVTQTDEAIVYYGSAGVMPVMKDSALNAAFKPFPVAERGGKVQEGYLYDYPAYCLSIGESVRWFTDQFGEKESLQYKKEGDPNPYARLDNLAQNVPAGCEGLTFLPYLYGQRSPVDNPFACGVFFGIRAFHQKAHFYRALLEAWGYSIRYGLECAYPNGYSFRRLVATGGGAKSRLWRQIVSDIIGIDQDYVPHAEGTIGAAYVAGLALGIFKDFKNLLQNWVTIQETTFVDENRRPDYERSYHAFRVLHEELKNTFYTYDKVLHQTGEKIHV